MDFFVKRSTKKTLGISRGLWLLTIGALISLSFFLMSMSVIYRSDQVNHTLPNDPEAIVIQWRTVGGLSGYNGDTADLTVYADGKTTVGPRLSQGEIAKSCLTGEQIQQLLSFAIDENKFFAFDARVVQEAVNDALEKRRATSQEGDAIAVPLGPPYIDAGTTIILIAADGKRHEVRYQGLFFAAQDFPEIEALQQLRAIELKLLSVAKEIANYPN